MVAHLTPVVLLRLAPQHIFQLFDPFLQLIVLLCLLVKNMLHLISFVVNCNHCSLLPPQFLFCPMQSFLQLLVLLRIPQPLFLRLCAMSTRHFQFLVEFAFSWLDRFAELSKSDIVVVQIPYFLFILFNCRVSYVHFLDECLVSGRLCLQSALQILDQQLVGIYLLLELQNHRLIRVIAVLEGRKCVK